MAEFNRKSTGENADAKIAADILYDQVFCKVLTLRVLLSGNDLGGTIDQLIEQNQQVTLDLNEAD